MSELQDLVPPLDLCKQIPAGAFADSALVWNIIVDEVDHEFPLIPREDIPSMGKAIPAPTLAEIMLALAEKNGYEIPAVYRDRDSSWYVEIKNSTEDRYHNRSHKDNAASAALKLWLDQENRIKAKGEPSK